MTDTIRIPGLVDLHVHFREPGFEQKETIETGARAAQASGYTDVFTMPNLNPAPDTVEHLRVQLDAIRRTEQGGCNTRVHPYGCITVGQRGEGTLVDFAALAPYVAGFSDDGRGVQSDDLMEQAMRECARIDKPIVAHCEVNSLLHGGYIHDGVYAREHGHRGICSESEWRQIERDIRLARKTGCQYHVCHISTKESVELIRRAKAEGVRISCETGPHYLLLDENDLREDGRFKMNPPLRLREDREELIRGIQDGTIDCIATDHAPHTAEQKSRGLELSAFGIVGLETAFPLMYTYLVRRDVITLARLVELMSLNARKIMRLGPVPRMITVDVATEWEIDPETFISKGHSTPFEGWRVTGKVLNDK